MKWMQKTDKINEMLAHKEAKYKEYYLKLSRVFVAPEMSCVRRMYELREACGS